MVKKASLRLMVVAIMVVLICTGSAWALSIVGLEIEGPDTAVVNSNSSYKAIAHYDIGNTIDVTNLAAWSVEPSDMVSINGGLLTTEMVDYPIDITITAKYSEGEVDETAEKGISIFAICPSGSALDFNGVNDYVNCGGEENLNVTGDITILAWIYLNRGGNGSDSSGQVIVAKTISRGAYNNPFDFRISDGPVPVLTLVRADSSGHEYLYSTEELSLNCWHHVVVTFNNNDCNFYLDGIITGQSGPGFTKPASGNSMPVYIGRRDDGLYFDGSIDEVAIYDRALSAEEIQGLMHSRPETDELSLVAYWSFDEGSGQIAADLAGGNDGTIVGADWFDSDAPVEICTAKGLIERNLLQVYEMKKTILEILEEAIATEDATKEYLNELFKSGEIGDLNKGDLVKAKQKIHSAIRHEEQAETSVNKSIDKLDDAMNTLGIE